MGLFVSVVQKCTTFLGQGPQHIIFNALEGQRQNYELKFQESSIKKSIFKNLTSLFIDYSLIFLPSELLRIVISCKIVISSMKFKFIHKFFLIQEKFLVFFKLFRGPDITRSMAGCGPRVVHPCCSRFKIMLYKSNGVSVFQNLLCLPSHQGLPFLLLTSLLTRQHY